MESILYIINTKMKDPCMKNLKKIEGLLCLIIFL